MNVKEHTPPQMESQNLAEEPPNGGCRVSSCSLPLHSSDEAICGGHSEEVADDGSGQPQSDLGQLAGTQLAHGYESPQVGLPHPAYRELLDASQSLPSARRIVPPTPHLGLDS